MLRPDTFALTALLALLTALGPLSTDMYLPSLPLIGTALGASTAQVQLTLSVFLVGFAAGQVIYGPLSDRFGRRPPLIGGLVLFVAASLICAAAPSIEALLAARFLQALGASGPIVLARTVVRDLYEGPRAARELALMGTIMGLVPAVAPVVGGLLQAGIGWQANFVLAAALAAAGGLVAWRKLPETLRAPNPAPISPLGIARSFAGLTRNRGFLAYLVLMSLTYGGLFAWISGSSFVLQGVYGLSALAFGFAFVVGVIGYIAGTLAAQALVTRHGIEATLSIGVACLALGGVAMLALVLAGIPHPAAIVVPMALYLAGVGLVMPQAMAGALAPFPDRAGAASSFAGFVQMLAGAGIGALVGHALGASALPLALAVAATGIAALVVLHASRAARAIAPAR
ncbi:multidrug effflux MFS transporter [Labrys wisconsinensis]|uniref:Bcr/CflA family efflux transporter n=1 Tax=Labrys wisconsinensis TaxID=425677 RepID=A0ABU0IZE2_9HYPH|nr:multidrug effflux MFS transporter [Labrys wisconsinensis]MDQ0467381.1 DHA1 family bicyclomycin/chloramphenicol resistance-like MFS transporter [Labrys wisconsinensis]